MVVGTCIYCMHVPPVAVAPRRTSILVGGLSRDHGKDTVGPSTSPRARIHGTGLPRGPGRRSPAAWVRRVPLFLAYNGYNKDVLLSNFLLWTLYFTYRSGHAFRTPVFMFKQGRKAVTQGPVRSLQGPRERVQTIHYIAPEQQRLGLHF